MKKLTELSNEIKTIFPNVVEKEIGEYSYLKYPKLLPMLKMRVKQYSLEGFGSIMVMNTSMMGLMKLSTFSFTPNTGLSVPFLLIDTMSMGKKRLAYFELYDCRKDKSELPLLQSLKDKYKDIEDYQEKEAWYIEERMEGSLIKCATKDKEEDLVDMLLDALKCYKECIDKADCDVENLAKLQEFANRMVKEGNPSSGTLNKVLGEEKAIDFFNKIVMPLK